MARIDELEDSTPVAMARAVIGNGSGLDLMSSLQMVIKTAVAHGGLARGLHESAKAIEKHSAVLCVIAEDCDNPDYLNLVQGLCAQHKVQLISVPKAKQLGEWAGLCRINNEGKACKVVGCSCVVVTDFGVETEAFNYLQDYVHSH